MRDLGLMCVRRSQVQVDFHCEVRGDAADVRRPNLNRLDEVLQPCAHLSPPGQRLMSALRQPNIRFVRAPVLHSRLSIV